MDNSTIRRIKQRELPFHKICEMVFTTDAGHRWHLDEMPFYVPIYDKPRNKLLLYTSRQSIKSTTLRNFCIGRSLLDPGSSSLFVAPTRTQIRTFSNEKLNSVFTHRPLMKDAFLNKNTKWNVQMKELDVGDQKSRITLRSVGGASGADRVRGISANDVYLDEFQSLIEEEIPVIESVAATFDGEGDRRMSFYAYAGTPLSKQNIIHKQWESSKQYQWHMQCPHCSSPTGKTNKNGRDIRRGGWNRPIGMQHIDPDKPYLMCEHCGKDMNSPPGHPRSDISPRGKWITHNPKGKFDGYRVVRSMMPWAAWRTEQDDGILDRFESWSERRFHNEVMALSYDSGTIPITEDMVRNVTQDYKLPSGEKRAKEVADAHRQYQIYAGLDWAMQAKDEEVPSYTIFGVFAEVNGKLKLIFAHRFQGQKSNDPDYVMKKIVKWMRMFGINKLGADYGIGYKEDLRLIRIFGQQRVVPFEYKRGGGRARSQYDEQSLKWIIPKTRTLDQLIVNIDNEEFILPQYTEVKKYTDDWHNLSIDMDPARRTIKYESTGPDDFVHVANYASIARRLDQRRGEFSPSKRLLRSQRDQRIAGTPRGQDKPLPDGQYPPEDPQSDVSTQSPSRLEQGPQQDHSIYQDDDFGIHY
jgi:hypothetical protein